jgi:transposase
MPRPRATPVTVTAIQRRVLQRRAHGHKTPHRDKIRAEIVLLAGAGDANNRIARRLGVTVDTVRTWRDRFAAAGLDGLGDKKRSGRPPRFTPVQVAEVTALACQLPAETNTPLARWSCPDLAREAVARGVADALSASTVRRWLDQQAIKPWQHRSWIFIRDSDFAVKAARVLDLYAGIWDGQPLGDNDYVICADEKTSIQARCRCHPTLPPGVSRTMRVNHEYHRGGALAYWPPMTSTAPT